MIILIFFFPCFAPLLLLFVFYDAPICYGAHFYHRASGTSTLLVIESFPLSFFFCFSLVSFQPARSAYFHFQPNLVAALLCNPLPARLCLSALSPSNCLGPRLQHESPCSDSGFMVLTTMSPIRAKPCRDPDGSPTLELKP